MQRIAKDILSTNIRILKSRVSKTAYQAVSIAVFAIIFATLAVCFYNQGEISLSGLLLAQRNNPGLWILNAMPFLFGFWGQYSSAIIAYEASALVFDQTQELRNRTEQLEQQASYTATHDALTALPNRSLFQDRVDQAISKANRQKHLLAVLLVEIENFKEIYDTLGRANSDQIIKQVASRLEGVVLGDNNVARIDSNMFAILLNEIDSMAPATRLAQHIIEALQPAFSIEQLQCALHCNVGIVHFPEHGEDVDTLIQKAGVASHAARNVEEAFIHYHPKLDEHSPKRLTLMSELRHAIERGQLELYYQAKVSLKDNTLYGAEALIRWHHPKHGAISPDEFIPMAERTRMIKPLTLWVLKEAFQQCATWRQQGKALIISINLSAKDLHDSELPDLIGGVAASTGIRPPWVILEITEGSILSDPELSLEIILRLKKMGYQFSIDDYGTGYSSLAYLKQLPLSELKIDRSFVSDILANKNDDVIVNATINLAHNLGLQVTAEGVENAEIMARLKDLNCDIVQGYYLNKPMSVNHFNQWMEESEWQLEQMMCQHL